MLGNEEAGGVVHGVAGATSHAEQLGLGLGPRSDVGDVGVAVLVDLTGAHHHVTSSTGERVEHAAERDPSLDGLVRSPDGQVAGDVESLAVGDHQIGLERGARETRTEHLHDAHAGSEDFAVPAPGFGAGHRDDVGECG